MYVYVGCDIWPGTYYSGWRSDAAALHKNKVLNGAAVSAHPGWHTAMIMSQQHSPSVFVMVSPPKVWTSQPGDADYDSHLASMLAHASDTNS